MHFELLWHSISFYVFCPGSTKVIEDYGTFSLVFLSLCVEFWSVFVSSGVFSIRVFLRAINTYADTMNLKFLNNNDFEVQVGVCVCVCVCVRVYLTGNARQYRSSPRLCLPGFDLESLSVSHSFSLPISIISCGITTFIWLWRLLPKSPCSFSTSPPPRGPRSWPSESIYPRPIASDSQSRLGQNWLKLWGLFSF